MFLIDKLILQIIRIIFFKQIISLHKNIIMLIVKKHLKTKIVNTLASQNSIFSEIYLIYYLINFFSLLDNIFFFSTLSLVKRESEHSFYFICLVSNN